MTLSGARSLIRVSQNPTCELLLGMVILGVQEVEFYEQLTGEHYPREYGERTAARKRGLAFEANLYRNDAILLREALVGYTGRSAAELQVLNLDDIAGHDASLRLDLTRQLMADISDGRPVPDVVIQPELVLQIAPDYTMAIRPDVLVFDHTVYMYKPLEAKSYVLRQSVANKADMQGTRLQAAVEVEALRMEAGRTGLADQVRTEALYVFATPYGLHPHPTVVERLDGASREVRRAFAALRWFKAQLDASGITTGLQLAAQSTSLRRNFQEACIGTCVLADVCKAQVSGRARALGDAAAALFGADAELARLEALLGGATPADQDEAEMTNALRAATHALGVKLVDPDGSE